MNKILSIALCIYLATHLTACTDSKTDEANPDQPNAEVSLENPDGSATTATADKPAGNPDEAQAGFLDDQLPEDSLGAAPADKKADTANVGTEAKDAAATPTLDNNAPLSLDEPASPPAPDTTASIDSTGPLGTETAAAAKTDEPAKTEEAPKPKATLQKIKDVPFHEDGQLLNAVYVARPGDDYKKISTMIYGSEDKAADLKKANPGLKKVKPGQKVYYNSPKRPQDEAKMMTYYEESGVPPEVYVAKDGDNLKKVSKELLGYSDGWKEIWATNSVESKGALPAGTELKYWKGSSAVATTTPPAPPMGSEGIGGAGSMAPPSMPPQANLPPPPPPQAQNAVPPMPEANLPPPPPPEMAKQADLPPPPPPPEQMAPPPPLPPMANAANKKIKSPPVPMDEGLDQETMMYLGVAGIIAAGLAGIIVVRKKKAQRSSAGLEAHVG